MVSVERVIRPQPPRLADACARLSVHLRLLTTVLTPQRANPHACARLSVHVHLTPPLSMATAAMANEGQVSCCWLTAHRLIHSGAATPPTGWELVPDAFRPASVLSEGGKCWWLASNHRTIVYAPIASECQLCPLAAPVRAADVKPRSAKRKEAPGDLPGNPAQRPHSRPAPGPAGATHTCILRARGGDGADVMQGYPDQTPDRLVRVHIVHACCVRERARALCLSVSLSLSLSLSRALSLSHTHTHTLSLRLRLRLRSASLSPTPTPQ